MSTPNIQNQAIKFKNVLQHKTLNSSINIVENYIYVSAKTYVLLYYCNDIKMTQNVHKTRFRHFLIVVIVAVRKVSVIVMKFGEQVETTN